MPRRTFLGRVLKQLLVINLPAQFLADAPADGAAARSGFTADGNGQRRGHGGSGGSGTTIALESVKRRLRERRNCRMSRRCGDGFCVAHGASRFRITRFTTT